MVGLNKPLSVRLTDEDMAFLSTFEGGDAVTPSEKVRALIGRAREERLSRAKPDLAHQTARTFLAPLAAYVQKAEEAEDLHSELLASELAWCEDLISDLVIFQGRAETDGADNPEKTLVDIERKLTRRLFLMVDRLMRYGLTAQTPAYDPGIVTNYLSGLHEFLELLKLQNRKVTQGE